MSLSRNITIGKLRSFFSMFLILVPILVPYWQSLGLSMKEILEVQAVFGLGVALFEVPTGYVGDLFGRKASLVLGSFIQAAGFSLLPWVVTYEGLIVWELVLALGASLCSGCDIALTYDSLPANANKAKVIGAMTQWSLVGEGVASLLSGVLVLYSLRSVVWAQAVVMWMPFVLSLFFIEPPIERMDKRSHFSNLSTVVRHIFVDDSLTRSVFLNSVFWGLSTFCVVWLLQPYWSLHNVPLTWFGLLWAALQLTSAFVSRYAHVVEAKLGASPTLLLIALCSCTGYCAMTLGFPAVGVAACFLFYISRGLISVVFVDAFNWKVPSHFRATANSMSSLAFRLGFAVVGPAIGWSIVAYGLVPTLFLIGCAFSLLAFVSLWPLCKRIDELRVDYIPE